MTTRSRTITVSVKRKTGDVFDAILDIPPKMMPDAKKKEDGSWTFTGERGPAKLKFFENKQHGILDHHYEDQEGKWHNSMRVVPSGDDSEIMITFVKPDSLSEQIFNERMKEMEKLMQTMKEIIEQN